MSAPHLRNRYLQDSVNTASPAKLLVMLYDRLVMDLVHGEEGIRTNDRDLAAKRINHAQEILLELRTTPERLTSEIAGFLDECWKPRRKVRPAAA